MKRLFFLISLFFMAPSIAYGATEFVSVVDPGNGTGTDYTSLSAWENAVQTNLTVSTTRVFSGTKTGTLSDNATMYLCRGGVYQTVTANRRHATATQILAQTISNGSFVFQSGDIWYTNNTCDSASYFILSDVGDSAIAVAKCRATNGTPDITAITVNGWTTGASNFIKIWTDPTEYFRHQGIWDDSKYRLEYPNSLGNAFTINEEYVRIEGLQISVTNQTYDKTALYISPANALVGDMRINQNIIKAFNTSSNYLGGINARYGSSGSTAVVKISNNLLYDFLGGNAFVIETYYYASFYLYNNTVVNSNTGYNANNPNTIAKNNIAQNCTDGFTSAYGWAGGTDYNISDLANDAPSPSYRTNLATVVNFANSGNQDFHLSASDSDAKDHGVDLHDDLNLSFNTDIDGKPRPYPVGGNWDIGADEYMVPPVLTEITPVTTSTLSSSPSYTFNSTAAGTIAYGGSCSSATTVASEGDNTITFGPLNSGTYSDCTIQVTDSFEQVSNLLSVTSFTISPKDATLRGTVKMRGDVKFR